MVRKTRYTIHEHRARRAGLHYDLRLQKGNDVYSFALPKARIPDENNVMLAILGHVDHDDLKALNFYGSIPKDEYGAGNLTIIENGLYNILDWPSDSSKIIFFVPKQIGGQILCGRYYLVKTSRGENQFIFGKSKKQ